MLTLFFYNIIIFAFINKIVKKFAISSSLTVSINEGNAFIYYGRDVFISELLLVKFYKIAVRRTSYDSVPILRS